MSNVEENASREDTAQKTPVDVVIDQLGKRMVPSKDVDRLDRAVQGAKVPLGGRAGADAGLGRATKR